MEIDKKKLVRYRIKGKTYYKVGVDNSKDTSDMGLEIWDMLDSKSNIYKLCIRHGSKTTSYTLYDSNSKVVLTTRSICKIVY